MPLSLSRKQENLKLLHDRHRDYPLLMELPIAVSPVEVDEVTKTDFVSAPLRDGYRMYMFKDEAEREEVRLRYGGTLVDKLPEL